MAMVNKTEDKYTAHTSTESHDFTRMCEVTSNTQKLETRDYLRTNFQPPGGVPLVGSTRAHKNNFVSESSPSSSYHLIANEITGHGVTSSSGCHHRRSNFSKLDLRRLYCRQINKSRQGWR